MLRGEIVFYGLSLLPSRLPIHLRGMVMAAASISRWCDVTGHAASRSSAANALSRANGKRTILNRASQCQTKANRRQADRRYQPTSP